MIIKSAKITKYKCIDDSGLIELEEKVTCLVGKNESGKTAALETIYRLNPIPSGHKIKFNGSLEYPRRLRSRESSQISSTTPITAKFVLENEDIAVIEGLYGPGALNSDEIEISKNYENEYGISLDLNEKCIIEFLLTKKGVEKEVANGCSSIEELIAALTSIENRPDAIERFLSDLKSLDIRSDIEDKVLELLPKFLYFDDYMYS